MFMLGDPLIRNESIFVLHSLSIGKYKSPISNLLIGL